MYSNLFGTVNAYIEIDYMNHPSTPPIKSVYDDFIDPSIPLTIDLCTINKFRNFTFFII